MIWLPAAIISCTAGGAPCGIAASPLGRTCATAPGVVGPLTGTHPCPPAGTGVVDVVAAGRAALPLAGVGVLRDELGDLRDLGRVVVPRDQRRLPVRRAPPTS